ncbi:hypothetical protein [Amycolatopsis sp. NPDC006125]|uniref:hypothetical protein n=1 Tax=Amycolatopsis sp. NPDC006125 TaxID=3156730 RepID=UPI0033A8F8D9
MCLHEPPAHLRTRGLKKARRKRVADKAAEAERDVLAKNAAMPESDRVPTGLLHSVVAASAPHLAR